MFTGINILNQSHFRLICFVRVKMTQRKVHNIFIPTDINCTTIIIILEGIEKLKTRETQSEQSSKYLSKLKPIVPTKCATMHESDINMCYMFNTNYGLYHWFRCIYNLHTMSFFFPFLSATEISFHKFRWLNGVLNKKLSLEPWLEYVSVSRVNKWFEENVRIDHKVCGSGARNRLL